MGRFNIEISKKTKEKELGLCCLRFLHIKNDPDTGDRLCIHCLQKQMR